MKSRSSKILLFLSCSSIFSIPFLINANIKNNINQNYNFANSKTNENNIVESNNNVGPVDFNVTPINVKGEDKLVWLIFGEGYREQDQENFNSKIKSAFDLIFNSEPMKSFSHLVNVYAVNVISKTTFADEAKPGQVNDTYFDIKVRNHTDPDSRTASMPKDGAARLDHLVEQLKQNYFSNSNPIFFEKSIVVNSNFYFRSGNNTGKYSIVDSARSVPFIQTIFHEASHNFAYLADEYRYHIWNRPDGGQNTANSIESAKEKWGEFEGYKWETPFESKGKKVYRDITYFDCKSFTGNKTMYIPYNPLDPDGTDDVEVSCLMKELSNLDFCPVCHYYFFDKLNTTFDTYYPWFWLKPYVKILSNSHLGNNVGTIDFQTVCRNYTNEEQKIRIEIDLGNNNQYTKEFIIPASRKPFKIFIHEGNQTIKGLDHSWKIVDTKTSKILLSSNEKMYTINVNFKDENNLDIPSNLVSNYSLSVKENDNLKLYYPKIQGYKFIGNNQDLVINNITSNKNIDLKYKKLQSKELNLVLHRADGKTIQRKKLLVYENQTFQPSTKDFLLNGGIKGFELEIKNPNPLIFNEINDQNNEITYIEKLQKSKVIYLGKEEYRVGGDHPTSNSFWDLIKIESVNGRQPSYSFTRWDDDLKQWNNVSTIDWNTPASYKMDFTFEDSVEVWELNNKIHNFTTDVSITFRIIANDGTQPPIPIDPPINTEIEQEINRINNLSLSLNKNVFTQQEIDQINGNNILQYINGLTQTTGFLYEVINFNNLNNQFKFQIKVSKDGSNKTSKEFTLFYQIQNPGQTEEELLQQEINRINNLTLSLISNTFTQDEIDKITTSNFTDKLSNWNLVTANSSKYTYEIATLNKENNKFSFTIKVTLKSDSSVSKTSKNFELIYQISASVNQDLLNEKNRIDKLDLSLNKPEFTKSEIEEILKNPNSITKYLNNWSPQNQFNYEFIINNSSDKNQLSLTIKITNQANANTEYQTSKEFILHYQISSSDNITNNSNNSNNLTTIVLASTLVPAGAIGVGTAGTIIYKKKKRKY